MSRAVLLNGVGYNNRGRGVAASLGNGPMRTRSSRKTARRRSHCVLESRLTPPPRRASRGGRGRGRGARGAMLRRHQHTIRCRQIKTSGREERTKNTRRLPQRQHPSAQRGLLAGCRLRRRSGRDDDDAPGACSGVHSAGDTTRAVADGVSAVGDSTSARH